VNRFSVSVIIAYHNGSNWIERALVSALNQTQPPKEIIIVDDGSSLSEAQFLDELALKFNFRLLRQPNNGQSSARNLGVTESNCEFICFLDQDDYYLANHIETLCTKITSMDELFGFAYGDLWRVTESGKTLSHSSVNMTTLHPILDLRTMLRNNLNIPPSATLISKSAFLKVGGFDPLLKGYEDDDLFIRLFVSGFRINFTSEAVTVWTLNRASTSFSEAMSESRYIFFNKLMRDFEWDESSVSRVFADLLFPRFGPHFADDVISASLGQLDEFAVRRERLRSFRKLVRESKELGFGNRFKYLLTTAPLAILGKKSLRLMLTFTLRFVVSFGSYGMSFLSRFASKYSTRKEGIRW